MTGKQVNLNMVAGVFIVLAVGLLLSFGVLGVEIMWHKRNRENLEWVIEIVSELWGVSIGVDVYGSMSCDYKFIRINHIKCYNI